MTLSALPTAVQQSAQRIINTIRGTPGLIAKTHLQVHPIAIFIQATHHTDTSMKTFNPAIPTQPISLCLIVHKAPSEQSHRNFSARMHTAHLTAIFID